MAGRLAEDREGAALALQALRQDAGLKERLEALIRQTHAAGVAAGDPFCLALAGQVGGVQRRAAGPDRAVRLIVMDADGEDEDEDEGQGMASCCCSECGLHEDDCECPPEVAR